MKLKRREIDRLNDQMKYVIDELIGISEALEIVEEKLGLERYDRKKKIKKLKKTEKKLK